MVVVINITIYSPYLVVFQTSFSYTSLSSPPIPSRYGPNYDIKCGIGLVGYCIAPTSSLLYDYSSTSGAGISSISSAGITNATLGVLCLLTCDNGYVLKMDTSECVLCSNAIS